jgi:mannose-1-phosphate guanylyltransferase
MKLYALIMAGGEGKRFWPLSTKDKPKQFLSLLGDKSLIRQTVDRILPLIPIERVFIVTVKLYAEETLKHIPELPRANLILEPEGKNTAPCIAYGSLRIASIDTDSVTAVLPADHAIGDEDEFRSVLEFAYEASGYKLKGGVTPLIMLGVKPSSPETGYGYIKAGDEEITSKNGYRALNVDKFTEKPDFDTAIQFLNEGDYYWNSGMFIWKTSSILREFATLLPDWSGCFSKFSADLGKPEESESASLFYSNIESGSIDKLILERSGNTLVIPTYFPWSDVGSWKALYEYTSGGNSENVLRGKAVTINSYSCMVIGEDRTIALVGVSDLVVVDTKDAVLVLNKESSQDVKKIVEKLGKIGKSD